MNGRDQDLLVKIMGCACARAFVSPESLRESLVLFCRGLAAEQAAILRFDAAQRSFVPTFSVSGQPGHASSARVTALGDASRGLQRPAAAGRFLLFPLSGDGPDSGILALSFSAPAPSPDTLPSWALAAGQALAGLAAALFPPASSCGDSNQETTTLFRLSQVLHSTLNLDELTHLVLKAAVDPCGGGFVRGMLFLVNERSQTLQGMFGVARDELQGIFSCAASDNLWSGNREQQSVVQAPPRTDFCRRIMSQRLPLDASDNVLARAVCQRRGFLVDAQQDDGATGRSLAAEFGLTHYACAPLVGRDGVFGVLVVDDAGVLISPARMRFFEFFASQAAVAMENALLVRRLETASQDLQEMRERLGQGEKMAVLGEMAASVAHELKNPLVALGGFARRLLRLPPDDARQVEYAEIIAREAGRMERMLGEILDFSRKRILCLADCNLADIVQTALALEQVALERAGITVQSQVSSGLPLLLGDELKLRQVFINLIANARQAMGQGGALRLKVRSATLRGLPAVAADVFDTGGGVSRKLRQQIFRPFFTTKSEGVGLGLAISTRIVEQHGGAIEVRNVQDGALFTVRLPLGADWTARARGQRTGFQPQSS